MKTDKIMLGCGLFFISLGIVGIILNGIYEAPFFFVYLIPFVILIFGITYICMSIDNEEELKEKK